MLSGGQNALACAGVSHSLSTPLQRFACTWRLNDLDVVHRMREHHHAALRKHHVVVEHLRERLPELDRMVVERGAFVEQVVRADDRRVAAGVAAADPALLEHGDIAQTVLRGEVIRGAEPMTAAADDDRIVSRLRLGFAPLRLPAAMSRQPAQNQRQRRKPLPAHAPALRRIASTPLVTLKPSNPCSPDRTASRRVSSRACVRPRSRSRSACLRPRMPAECSRSRGSCRARGRNSRRLRGR